ncbi:MAG: CBASS cGAMP-activated phospholipase [Planctomycetota bacterium]
MPERPFRVLSLDGGGMRGAYTATYLAAVASGFSKRRGVGELDVGAAFDLIVGTSVGGIIACSLAAGVPMDSVVSMFREDGPRIFPRRLPAGFGWRLVRDLFARPRAIRAGAEQLRTSLSRILGTTTIKQLYERRGIALAITAVEMGQHRSWVFKTPHLASSNHRDDGYTLVDVCLSTTAAPIYRSLAAVDHPDSGPPGHRVFVDGGLWANNPVLVGLIEALELARPAQEIQIFCLGTCPQPAGESIQRAEVDRGLLQWKFGGLVAPLAIDAQEFAFDNMARMLAKHFATRVVSVTRFPGGRVPAALMKYLDLDETRPAAIDALINQARSDADIANSTCSNPKDAAGHLICRLFDDAPVASPLAPEARAKRL